jgi:glutathione S-transferase
MAIDLYWGSGSAYSWRVLLALEYKRLAYVSHLLQFSKQEHKSPQILALNFRGRVPILKDGDYVVFESLAVLYYLDLKYPEPPIFGHSPEEAGVIMRVICEYQSYAEPQLMRIVRAFLTAQPQLSGDELASAMHVVASEARSIEARLARSDWVVGDSFSAADIVIFPGLQLLLRALAKPQASDISSRFLPLATQYPALARWIARVESLPGYDRTYPPHWRSQA